MAGQSAGSARSVIIPRISEPIPVIPAWVHRRVTHCLHGVSLWSDPHMWLTYACLDLNSPVLLRPNMALVIGLAYEVTFMSSTYM